MRGVFDDEEEDLRHEKSGRDTELTLGAGMLLMLFFGLVLVCGLCFGLGYAVGHHAESSQPVSASSTPAGPAVSSIPKPSAEAQPPASPVAAPGSSAAPAATAADLPQATAAVAVPVGSPQPATSGAPATPSSTQPAAQPQVRPALPLMTSQPPPPVAPVAPTSAPANAQAARSAAIPPQNQLWVQIAAVSHVEDAEVLTNALRRRGYTVTPRRELSDNLIHVRIGPFATQGEANQWRLKLLNDGYNAEIQR